MLRQMPGQFSLALSVSSRNVGTKDLLVEDGFEAGGLGFRIRGVYF